MKLIITPTYSDIFEGERPDLNTLLKDIPSSVTISVLCLINAKLYSEENSFETQFTILKLLMQRQREEFVKKIVLKVLEMTKRNDNEIPHIFTSNFCLDFIHYELIHFRSFLFDDTTPEQELNFLKAYLLVVEQSNKESLDSYELNSKFEGDYFNVNTWPTLVTQVEANLKVNYVAGMVKAIAFFNFLEYHSPYSQVVKDFLLSHGKRSTWNYVLDLLGLVKLGWDNYKENESNFFPISLVDAAGFTTLFQQYMLDVEEYQANYSIDKKNYTGLKEKPLYYLEESDRFLVINWNFIINKLYEGLLFDFYKFSTIQNVPRFKSFIRFKEYVSREVTEKFIFRRIISKYFVQKGRLILFDEGDSFPDCYCRVNRRIFIIEIKDSYFPTASIGSFSYPVIKETIDKKYNSVNKGVGQIVKYIKLITQSPYEKDNFLEKGIKCKNIEIYPVLIYTDKFFGMPGVNNYLNEEFQRIARENDLEKHFKQIHPLAFIDFNFLIEYVHKAHTFTLDQMIRSHSEEFQKRTRRFKRHIDLGDFMDVSDTFETMVLKRKGDFKLGGDRFFEVIVKTLDLTEGLEAR